VLGVFGFFLDSIPMERLLISDNFFYLQMD
jgi:hypothetical protein